MKVEKAIEVFKNNGLVIFPTETVYGIGCRLGSKKAITKLYKVKKRESKKPTSKLVADLKQAKKYATFTKAALLLAKKFWPGPLTLVLKAEKTVPKEIQGQGETVGLRQPSQKILLKILKGLKEPILAPSANFTGEKAPTNLDSVDSSLKGMVDYVVDEPSGGLQPSTVIDLTLDKPTFLREGSISSKTIERILVEET